MNYTGAVGRGCIEIVFLIFLFILPLWRVWARWRMLFWWVFILINAKLPDFNCVWAISIGWNLYQGWMAITKIEICGMHSVGMSSLEMGRFWAVTDLWVLVIKLVIVHSSYINQFNFLSLLPESIVSLYNCRWQKKKHRSVELLQILAKYCFTQNAVSLGSEFCQIIAFWFIATG